MPLPAEVDYIIVGGGLTGSALASRLSKLLGSKSSILILEAGPDPTSNPYTTTPMAGFALQGSELDWSYVTAPIPSTSERVITLAAGKTLGGGSVLSELSSIYLPSTLMPSGRQTLNECLVIAG